MDSSKEMWFSFGTEHSRLFYTLPHLRLSWILNCTVIGWVVVSASLVGHMNVWWKLPRSTPLRIRSFRWLRVQPQQCWLFQCNFTVESRSVKTTRTQKKITASKIIFNHRGRLEEAAHGCSAWKWNRQRRRWQPQILVHVTSFSAL